MTWRAVASPQRRDDFPDGVEGALSGFGPEVNGLAGAVEIDQPDVAEPRADHHVGRIAREPRSRDAVLHDVEGLHHHGGEAGPAFGAEELALERALRRE